MNPKQLITNDDAVSPVIGVILMVAITVILAAVIASFVLGLGEQTGPAAPQASIDCDLTNNVFVHEGGDALEGSQLSVQGTGSPSIGSPGTITAGDTFGSSIGSDAVLVWENPDTDSTSILKEC